MNYNFGKEFFHDYVAVEGEINSSSRSTKIAIGKNGIKYFIKDIHVDGAIAQLFFYKTLQHFLGKEDSPDAFIVKGSSTINNIISLASPKLENFYTKYDIIKNNHGKYYDHHTHIFIGGYSRSESSESFLLPEMMWYSGVLRNPNVSEIFPFHGSCTNEINIKPIKNAEITNLVQVLVGNKDVEHNNVGFVEHDKYFTFTALDGDGSNIAASGIRDNDGYKTLNIFFSQDDTSLSYVKKLNTGKVTLEAVPEEFKKYVVYNPFFKQYQEQLYYSKNLAFPIQNLFECNWGGSGGNGIKLNFNEMKEALDDIIQTPDSVWKQIIKEVKFQVESNIPGYFTSEMEEHFYDYYKTNQEKFDKSKDCILSMLNFPTINGKHSYLENITAYKEDQEKVPYLVGSCDLEAFKLFTLEIDNGLL